ncbi:MAG: universal stress protein, partial [Actinomycetota bacterium]|nr:universal stress protein [Actinomycetota bacterium]
SHQLGPDAAMILFGQPAMTLLDALDDFRPDVLVVGTLQRKRLDRLLMGSTVERLVGDAPCDVLVIPVAAVEVSSESIRNAAEPAEVH